MTDQADARRVAPAAERNKDAILNVLRDVLPAGQSNLLEVAAGTGQHAVHFAAALAHVTWWPCELAREPRQYRGLQVSVSHHKSHAITAARCDAGWLAVGGTDPSEADFILCCNMIHIAPWAACLGLLEGAGTKLLPGGGLMLYGPFRRQGVETAPSNEAFDAITQAAQSGVGLAACLRTWWMLPARTGLNWSGSSRCRQTTSAWCSNAPAGLASVLVGLGSSRAGAQHAAYET
jgi:hypothetical protein